MISTISIPKITGLQTSLDSKASTTHNHVPADLQTNIANANKVLLYDVNGAPSLNTISNVNVTDLAISKVTNL